MAPPKKRKKRSSEELPTQEMATLSSSKMEDDAVEQPSQLERLSSHSKPTQKAPYTAHRRKAYEEDQFPGDAPVPSERMKKYKRVEKYKSGMMTTHHHKMQQKATKKYQHALKQSARSELLLPEEAGFLEADEGEDTTDFTQHAIAEAVDISSAEKFFDLKLDKFGPYRINYTRNGRCLLIGGAKGHVAAFDWQTKRLMCEMNVMETLHDVKWLHQETMFAVAQKKWTYIYDNQGLELHCLKHLDSVLRMEFLPYHFLLCTANERSYLSYLDVSVGQKVAGFGTGLGRLDVMCQNPANAIIHLGHSGGTVTLWSPNVKEPLVKMLCHGVAVRAVCVDPSGKYMATSSVDRTIKLWDLRTFKELGSSKVGSGPSNLVFSQRGLLAAGIGNTVQVYKDPRQAPIESTYLCHKLSRPATSVQFCPYEDVLGVGHGTGFTSLLIPGAGEPNFDALEANPYQSKSQRREAEVKMLLDKIQPEMITMDTGALGQLDHKTVQEYMAEKAKKLYLKPKKVDFEPRFKKKGRSKTGNYLQRKKGVEEERKLEQVREAALEKKQEDRRERKEEKNNEPYNVFKRFKKKNK